MANAFLAIWPSFSDPRGIRVVWRALTCKEYQQVIARHGHLELKPDLLDPVTTMRYMHVYLDVYKRVVLSGPPVDSVSAGMCAQVALHQLNNNPFSGNIEAVRSAIQIKRSEMENNWFLSARAYISAVFRISFDEMDKWDPELFFERFVQAEHILGRDLGPLTAEEILKLKRQALTGTGAPRNARQIAIEKARARRRKADREEAGMTSQDQLQDPDTESFSWTK